MKKLIILIAILLTTSFASAEAPRSIKADIGEEFIIVLESNGSTGYQWQLAKPLDGNVLGFLKSEYIPGDQKMVATPGKEEWSFKALNSGKTVISLKYIRPWEKPGAAARTKDFTVIINEQPKFTGNDYLALSKRDREATVRKYISNANRGGVTIKNSAIFYCKKLDAFYSKSPNQRREPLETVLKTLIIMEYDWSERGVDKERLAREWLGDDLYKANKKRRQL